MSDKPRHGGRRKGAGRPRLAEKRQRVGTLYLLPSAIAYLEAQRRDGETLIQTAARLLEHIAQQKKED